MGIVNITGIDDERVAAYVSLTERQLRSKLEPARGIFIAESPKVIARALDAGMHAESFLMERRWLDAVAPLVEQAEQITGSDIPVYTGESAELAKLTGFALTRGVLCAMRRPTLPTVEELLAHARRVAVLESIVDHTNVGAAFRSAAALNVDAVLVTPTCADWPEAGIARLRALGFKTAAFALEDRSISLADPALAAEERLALVFGTEGDGLAPATIASCDYTVKIPMAHGVDSLNVAAATAVAFWQLCNHE